MGSCQLAGSKLVSSNTHLVPGGECGLEGGEGAAGDGLGGVLGEEGGDEPVEDGGGQRRRRVTAATKAEAAEGRELLGEAVEPEQRVADGEALRRGGGGVGRVGFRRGFARRRRGRSLPLGLPGAGASWENEKSGCCGGRRRRRVGCGSGLGRIFV